MSGFSNVGLKKSTRGFWPNTSLMIFVLMLWLQSGSCMPHFTPDDICGVQMYTKPLNCSYGSFIINLEPRFCADTEICYRGLGEPCKSNILEIRCARGLACKCGRCMNCLGGDCNMEVWCQSRIDVPKRVSIPYGPNFLRFYNNRGDNQYN